MAKELKDHNYYGIDSTIVADSVNQFGHRITSFVCTFPRHILAELNTHRMFSRNSASSRAIPFNKVVKSVIDHPFIPIAWQKEHSGMQGTEYIEEPRSYVNAWLAARTDAVINAERLNYNKLTKQVCNRLLEPFMWHTAIVTATHYGNFFKQRCPEYYSPVDKDFLHKSKKDLIAAHSNPENLEMLANFSTIDWLKINKGGGEIHIMALAESMWDNYNENQPKFLSAGEWHIPFGDNIDEQLLKDYAWRKADEELVDIDKLKRDIATARCARISYGTFEGKEDYEADVKLADKLASYPHPSPFEHIAQCMTHREVSLHKKIYVDKAGEIITEHGWLRNFQGFKQLRAEID